MAWFNDMNDNTALPLNPNYKEILKLHDMLEAEHIPHELSRFYDGYAVCYLVSGDVCICDAVEHCCSYGSKEDLIEILGLAKDDSDGVNTEGYLTADEVFQRIKIHYESTK